MMKDRIRSAQIVVPCRNLTETLDFFIERLGFRLAMIVPADAPQTAVISGYGVVLRLESAAEIQPLTINLVGDFSPDEPREIYSPDGNARVRLTVAAEEKPDEITNRRPEFVLTAPAAENSWRAGRAGLQYRDLIPDRVGGRFIASHIRHARGGEIPDYVHYHRVRFQMIYCLAGWARVVYENQGSPFVMRAGDCILQPPEIRHRVFESSAGFEVLEIGSPAVHETFADYQMPLPNAADAPEKLFGNQRFVRHVAEKAVWNKSPIEGFEERDAGIAEATGGLADVRVFRAISPAGFSVKHSDEFLFFFILKGRLRLSDGGGDGKIYHLKAGGSFVLPAGEEYLIESEQGLEILRVALPAEQLEKEMQ
jgi:mannose-6-phosphate isomerase-like protein (cupin superfamily)